MSILEIVTNFPNPKLPPAKIVFSDENINLALGDLLVEAVNFMRKIQGIS